MESNVDYIGLCCPDEKIKQNILLWQRYKGVDEKETRRAFKDIYIYGKRVLESDEYLATFNQTHHHILSVGEHTLHVTLRGLSISYDLIKKGYSVNINNVVIACLCHDLGIIGRYDKFDNNLICCYLHPLHSARIAERLIDNLPRETRKAISRHMFPATLLPPLSLTGFILISADKSSAITEAYLSRKLKRIPSYT